MRCFFILFLIAIAPLSAAFTIKDGQIVNADFVATMPPEDHFSTGLAAFEKSDWSEAARNFIIVTRNFPKSAYAQESFFYEGASQYHLEEYDTANDALSRYLEEKSHPRLFTEAIEYKFAIAEKFREGARRRLLGTKQLPKWAAGEALALTIYDQVIAAVPCHDIAARALYAKASLHWTLREYRDAVDCFQMLVRRFPKHELTPESYLAINKVYFDQCCYEFQNPDILAFSQINLRRFQQQFPKEERMAEAERDLLNIQEVYGKGLYDTGLFYERLGKPNASVIYYENAIRQFPETRIAKLSADRLRKLGYSVPTPEPNENSPPVS